MKAFYKSAFALLTLNLALVACQKDLLEVAPPDRLSTSVLWTQESDADLVLTGCYNPLLAGSGGFAVGLYNPYAWDGYSDDVYDVNGFSGGLAALTSGLTPQTGSMVSAIYTNSYKANAYINYFLANVDKVLKGDKLKQYQGEAYFLRAFHYFWLAQLYGNVIVSTEDLSTGDFNARKAKSTRQDVMKQVQSDLDLAIANLPDVKYGNGHAVKSTAQGYKIRALLFEKQFKEAAAVAAQVIASGNYSLNAGYGGNFYKPAQNSSPEIMFSIKFLMPNVLHQDIGGLTTHLLHFRNFQATQDLIDEYETTSGKFINEASSGYDPAKPATNRDPRMRLSFFFNGDNKEQGWPYTGSNAVATVGKDYWIPGFYLIKKWTTPTLVDPYFPVRDDTDFVLLRYADVLLMQAEAENEATGPANAYASVNQVRARAGMPALPAGLSQSQMRDRIRHERRVELAMEGLRYFDMRRWGTAVQKLNGFVQDPNYPNIKTKYLSQFEFWPIPQTEIDRNAPVLTQNPGY